MAEQEEAHLRPSETTKRPGTLQGAGPSPFGSVGRGQASQVSASEPQDRGQGGDVQSQPTPGRRDAGDAVVGPEVV